VTVGQGLFLGAIQGLTEFLPISSSGHLVIFQQLLGLTEPVLTFDVFIHMGTLLAILIFFGRSLFKVTFREWVLVAIGTVPAAAVGILFKDQIAAMFSSGRTVGLELIVSGCINFYTDRKLNPRKPGKDNSSKLEGNQTTEQLTPLKSIGIGIAQAIAIIPGISRSGSTVAGAVAFGLKREEAFRFSFLLAIPALLGAGVLEAKDVLSADSLSIEVAPYLAGVIAAFGFGLASLALFRYVINKAKLEWFGWYCVILGVIALVFIR